MNPLRIFIGFDEREALAYQVCENSIRRHASRPLFFMPLALNTLQGFYSEGHAGGSNAFTFSRFLVPYLCNFSGPALYLDSDIIVRDDISKLFDFSEQGNDVMVVKHNYATKHPVKYFGAPNPDYEKKNWSSVMLFPNCSNFPCQKLTPRYIQENSGKHLHRFEWSSSERIGSLPLEWNWLVDEYEHNDNAKLLHYTVAIPAIHGYEDTDHAKDWWDEYHLTMRAKDFDVKPRTKALIY